MDDQYLKSFFLTQAKKIFEGNLLHGHAKWNKTDYEFIAPAAEEYTYQFLWDTAFHAIVLSHFDVDWAKAEIRNFLKAQWKDGFLPHIIFWGGSTANLPHWAFIESKLSLRPHTTAITQPPMFPIAVEAIMEKGLDQDYLLDVLPKLAKHQRWLLDNRDPDGDKLISIISPNESGMDELPTFQIALGYKGNDANFLHYIFRKPDLLNQYYRFDYKKILSKDYFNVEELLFNCVFIEANRALSRLFDKVQQIDESQFFNEVANKSEKSLLNKCWNSNSSIFYSLYSSSEKQSEVKTIASLIPIFLSHIPKSKLVPLITKHLLNPTEFWTAYPIPSVSADEAYYEASDMPIYKGKLIWRGPTWVNTNWFVVKGLRKHGYTDIANQIVDKMCEMIQKWGFREYYNPETGQGYRRENFGWSTLIADLL